MRKGISTIIAVMLMVVLTIGLGMAAWSFMSGWLRGKTAVILTITDQDCETGGAIRIWVRNDGTKTSDTLTFTVLSKPAADTGAVNCAPNAGIAPGQEVTITCTRADPEPGMYRIRISTTGAHATAEVMCAG